MSLFQRGYFTLHSGEKSGFKIDCDALTDEDIETIAWMIQGKLRGPFGSVEGVPTGGLRLADAMQQYARPLDTDLLLIVDDVYTTGGSMREHRARRVGAIGAVIFSRGVIEPWIHSLFRM